MERRSTAITRDKIYTAIKSVLNELNSESGKIKIGDVSIKVGQSIRKIDLYSIISEVSGTGLCEKTIERYYKEYVKHENGRNTKGEQSQAATF